MGWSKSIPKISYKSSIFIAGFSVQETSRWELEQRKGGPQFPPSHSWLERMGWSRMRGAKLWKSAFPPAAWSPPTLPPEQQPLSCASFLFPKLQLGRSGVSNFNHMYFKKKIKRSLFGLQSHIFQSSVCASDLKRIENRGSGEKKERNQTFLSRCLNFNWFQKHWKQQPREENRNHTQPAAQRADGAAGKCSKCALCPGQDGYPCNAWPVLFHCWPETALGFCKCQREQEGSWDHFPKTELTSKDRNTCRSFSLVIQH